MANWNITLKTQSVNAFSSGPSTKWGGASSFTTMVWGTALWGEGESLPLQVDKFISFSAVTPSWARYRVDFTKQITIGSPAPSFEMSSENLSEGNWYFVYPSQVTEAENRAIANWTAGTSSTQTFTCQAAGSTSWS